MNGGTLTVIGGTFPACLDPSYGCTTQAIEADNMVCTPLLAYPPTTTPRGRR